MNVLLIIIDFGETIGTFLSILLHFHEWETKRKSISTFKIMIVDTLLCTEPTDLGSCVWPTQEIKKPLQLEAYLCLNYLRMVDLNESEAGFSMVHS